MKTFLFKGDQFKRFKRKAKALMFCFLAGIAATAHAQSVRMSLGDDFGALIDTDGSGAGVMYLWGAILGEDAGTIEPVAISERWKEVSVSQTPATDAHFLAIHEDGTLWAWGNNDRGQLGLGDQVDRSEPQQISTATDWVEIAAGKSHSLARKSDGRLYVWGDNTYGQLNFASSGNPTQDLRDTFPTSPIDANSYTAISAGAAHSHAIRADGTLWAWGSALSFGPRAGPELGVLINGSFPINQEVVPMMQVGTGAGWTDLFGGQSVTFATRDSGSETGQLWVWGRGGHLGLDLTITRETPTRVGSLTGWSNVSVSSTNGTIGHTLAIRNGALYAWGVIYNTYVPTLLNPAVGSGDWAAIGAGSGFSALFDSNNDLFTIGANDVGQLANGTTGTGQTSFGSTLFGEGTFDLVAVSVERTSAGTVFRSGDSLAFDIRISNLGSAAVAFPATQGADFVAARLLPVEGSTATAGADLTAVSAVPDGVVIPAYGETTLSFTGTIPSGVSVGQYRLEVDIDAGNVVEEFSETNNTVASVVDEENPAIEFTVDLRPVATALSVTKLTNPGSSSYELGDRFSVSYTVENLGTGVIRAVEQPAHRLRFVLTPNAGIVTGDKVLELLPVGAESDLNIDQDIGAEGSSPYTAATHPDDANPLEFEIPSGVEAINYYLAIVVDSTNAISERDEENNTAFTATKLIQIDPVLLWEALDLLSDDPSLDTTGDADWFGFFAPDAPGAGNNDAAFSPQLDAGEQSSIRLNVGADASIVTFSWKASTSGDSNFLQLNAGARVLTLSGETGWITESIAVPAKTVLTWTYFAGAGGAGEQVFLDAVSVARITGPDVIVPQAFLLDATYTPITADSVSVVAGDDSSLILAYELRNQGEALPSGGSLKVRGYLSRDTVLDPLEDAQVDLDPNDERVDEFGKEIADAMDFIYNRSMPSGLSDSLIHQVGLPVGLFGDYFLIIALSDVSGETDAAVLDNNTYVMEGPIVTVEALPDLVVEPEHINRNVFFLGNSVLVDYKLKNFGFGDAFGLVQLRLVFSEDKVYDPATDFTIGQGIFFGGIGAGSPLSSTVSQNSLTLFSIPPTVPIGDFRYIGLVVDPANNFAESNEANNAAFFDNPEYAFGNISLEVALDVADSAVLYSIAANFNAPFSTGFPFFGQTAESSDGIDAARSAAIGDGEKSFFEIEVSVPVGQDYIVNFDWKVSSEEKDRFFLYRDGSQVKVISGETDWISDFVLLPGRVEPYTLRWSYEKDLADTDGEDFAWVDQISVEPLTRPDFVFDNLIVLNAEGDPANELQSRLIGEDVLILDYRLSNLGVDFDPSVLGDATINFYLSEDASSLPDASDLLLGSVEIGQILLGAVEENRVEFNLPTTLDPGFYYILAVADPISDALPIGLVDERREDNNAFVTASRIVELIDQPDLEITRFEIPLDDPATSPETESENPLGLYVRGTDTIPVAELSLRNNGRSSILDDFSVQFLLQDTINPTNERSLGSSIRSQTLEGGAEDVFSLALSVPNAQELMGRRFFLKAFADSSNVIVESNETNNTVLLDEDKKVVVFADASLEEALNSSPGFFDNLPIENNELAPFPLNLLPFVGLSGTGLDASDTLVARSIATKGGETAQFIISLPELNAPQALAFEWKADRSDASGFEGLIGGRFEVLIDGLPAASIEAKESGFVWSSEILPLSQDAQEVGWRLKRNDVITPAQADVYAYLNALRFLPNLEVEIDALTNPAPGQELADFSPEEEIQFTATLSNSGLGDVPDDEAILVEARLSTDLNWDSGDYTLEIIQESVSYQGLAAGTDTQVTFTARIPAETQADNYFLLLRVDADSQTISGSENGPGFVLEVSDSDNTADSGATAITVSTVSIIEGLDMDEAGESGFEEAYNRPVFPLLSIDQNLVQTGDASWASTPNIEVQDFAPKWYAGSGVNTGDPSNTDAIRTAALDAGSAASLLFRVDEPRLVRFRVKANTASSSNYLFFGANGNELRPEGNFATRYAGVSPWEERYYVVPGGAPLGFTFVQGTTPDASGSFPDGEFVYVDDFEFLDLIDKPDFVVESLQYAAGEYVLQRDELYVIVTGRNRGQTLTEPLPDDFKVKVWLARNIIRNNGGTPGDLSDDRVDFVDLQEIGELEDFQELADGTRFAYQASINLPLNLLEGNYYLIARVDADNVVDEFAIDLNTGATVPEPSAFAASDNNYLISNSADIFIDRRADLRIAPSLDSVYNEIELAGPARQSETEVVDFFVIEPTDDEGPSELFAKFDLLNEGLSGVSAADGDDFAINVYAANSRDEPPSEERLITSFIVEDGLETGARRTFEITTAIPPFIDSGSFYYLNVVADGSNVIDESDEEDNNTFSRHSKVFVSDVSLEVALNDEELDRYQWDKSFVVPTPIDSTLQAPFFGTKDEFGQDNSDSGVRASAQSGPVGVGGTSWLQKTVDVTDGSEVQVSFLWKVSSQFVITPLGIAEDILEFAIRFEGQSDFTRIAKISGEREWAQFIHTITEPGNHTLRWSYIENGDDSRMGEDAGWVDDYSEASFDFVPTFDTSSIAASFAGGDLMDLPIYVWNLGALQIPDSGIEVETRLVRDNDGDTTNQDWTIGDSSDVRLQRLVSFDSLALGELVTLQTLLKDQLALPAADRSLVTAVTIDELNEAMDAAILNLLDSERDDFEPVLEEAEIQALEAVLNAFEGTWLDYSEAQLQVIMGVGETLAEQASRRRFLPVRTYRGSIQIPSVLSQGGNYHIGVWANPSRLFTESNYLNNLLYSDGASVTLNVDVTIPEALDRGVLPASEDDYPTVLADPNDWTLAGQGQWFPDDALSVEGGSALRFTDTGLAQDQQASIIAEVEGPKLIRFSWRSDFGNSPDTVAFFVNNELARREQGGVSPTAISLDAGDDGVWQEEVYLLPAGFNEIRWTYTRRLDSADRGSAYLDYIRFEEVTKPDFAITNVVYTPGTYALERDRFPVTITALNRGAIPVGFDYNDLSLEVRLGGSRKFDDANAFIGSLAMVAVLDEGQRFVFQGSIDLPLNLEEGSYYLLASIKSLDPDFEEFTFVDDGGLELLANNDYASTLQDVIIRHLPQLEVRTTSVENEKLYYPKETIQFDWEVENVGLGDIPLGTELTQTVELWSVGVDEELPSLETGTFVLEIGQVSEITALKGRLNATDRAQSTIAYRQVYQLPSQAELLSLIAGVAPGLEDLEESVIAELAQFEEFKFFFVLQRDGSIEQSSNLAITAVTDELFRISAFPYDDIDVDGNGVIEDDESDPRFDLVTDVDYERWRDFVSPRLTSINLENIVTGAEDELFGPFEAGQTEAFENLYYYAFNLPMLPAYELRGSSPRVETKFGQTGLYLSGSYVLDNVTYSSITFPMVRGATDLVYRVESSSDGGTTWGDALEIAPPYLDRFFNRFAGYAGSRSLTDVNASDGVDSLVEQSERIVSVVDHNYTASVTVRAPSAGGGEIMRVVVDRVIRLPEIVINQPGTGGTGAPTPSDEGFEVVATGPLTPGDSFDLNFDLRSLGLAPVETVRLQVRLVSQNTGTVDTLDWSGPGTASDIILFNDLVQLDVLAGSERYGEVRETITIPENIVGSNNYYIAVWIDYLNQIPTELDKSDNLQFSDLALSVNNPLTIGAAIDSDLILNPVVVWTPSGDGLWYPVYDADASPNPGSAPNGAIGDHAVRSPVLAAGQTAILRTSFGDIPRVIRFDWWSRLTGEDSRFRVVAVASGEVLFETTAVTTEWQRNQEIVVPAGVEVEFRFTAGDSSSDYVFVDNLRIEQDLTAPDFILTGVELSNEDGQVIPFGSYVLQRDQLLVNVTALNQGTNSTGNFSIRLYLSADEELDLDGTDLLIRDYLEDEGSNFKSGNAAVNGFVIDLDDPAFVANLAAGDYYLIGVINPADATPGVDENGRGDNNTLVSDGPVVEIIRLPDLVVTDFLATAGYYQIEEDAGSRGFIDFEFVIRNQGIADVEGPLTVRVLLSNNSTLDPTEDYTLLEYTFNGSLPAESSQRVDPDSVELRNSIPLGEYQFMGALIDAGDVVTESNENNNGGLLRNEDFVPDNDFVFSLRDFTDGLDLSPAVIAAQGISVLNDEVAPYQADAQPWVVQSAETFDGSDAVTNVLIGDDETASFSVEVNPVTDVRVSFRWKVSSQNELVEGINQRDHLRFYVNGVEAVDPIFGTDNEDWRGVEVSLSAGSHTLTWSYEKDDQGSEGEDRGWVDSLVVSELPNLRVTGVNLLDTPVYRPDGDSIDTWSVRVTNTGASDILPGTEFDVQVRLSPTQSWTGPGVVNLLTFTDSAGLAAGEERTYDQDSFGALPLPEGSYADEFYYGAAYVDWSPSDVQNGQITESLENDNVSFTAFARVQVGHPDVVVRADAVTVSPATVAYDDLISVDVEFENIGDGVLLGTSSFDLRVFLLPEQTSGLENSSLAFDLGTVTVTGSEVAPGGTHTVSLPAGTRLPYGVANGDYYVGVVVDSGDDLFEQGPLLISEGDSQDRPDGEGNNLVFTSTAVLTVDNGISFAEALDQPILPLDFETSGDGLWFTRSGAGHSLTGDDRTFVNDNGVQNPILAEGESASFSFRADNSYTLVFDFTVATGSSQTGLEVRVANRVIDRFSGDASGTAEFSVGAGELVTWTYTQGPPSSRDIVTVDNLGLTLAASPDFVFNSINLTSGGLFVENGRYVLNRDLLDVSMLIRNQGLTHEASDPDFDIRVYLSLDPSLDGGDHLISTKLRSGAQNAGESSIVLDTIDLPTSIPGGNYYLIGVIDEDNAVSEIFDTNNIFVSPAPIVEIVRLPNLTASNVNPDAGGLFFTGETLNFAFDLNNTGLVEMTGDMKVRIVLSEDNVMDLNDYVLGEFVYSGGLATGGEIGDSVTLRPDEADIRADIPIATFLYLGVLVDSGNDFEELNEFDNGSSFSDPHFVFGHVPLDEAVELDEIGSAAANVETPPFSGDKPFVGQTVLENTYDRIDAAQSTRIGDGETAAFETTIVPEVDTLLSFRWKVSSEFTVLESGESKSDNLVFYVNDVQVESIAGSVDWTEVRTRLDAGQTYNLRWAYEKDGSLASGDDAGWVDNIRTRLPNLVVSEPLLDPIHSSAIVGGKLSLNTGDSLSFSFVVTNTGSDSVPIAPLYSSIARLSNDTIWGNDGDVSLELAPVPSSTKALAPGESETFTVSAEIPPSFAEIGDFFLAIRVDPDPLTLNQVLNGEGLIPESDEADNTTFTQSATIRIVPTITLSEAVDDSALLNFTLGGATSWYGIDRLTAADLPEGTDILSNPDLDDIARSGPVGAFQSSYFESLVEGPALVKFRWKVESNPGANFLRVNLNGVPQAGISGYVDWDFGYGPFTLTYEDETTEVIQNNADAAEVETALNSLSSVSDAGGVTVTGGPLEYVITFNLDGNRPVLIFTPLTSVRVASGGFATTQNGGSSVAEIQTLTVEPNLFYTLSYNGQNTDPISYLATASEVETALNKLASITGDGGVSVIDHPQDADDGTSDIDFLITFNDPGTRNLILVNATNMRQPLTVEAELNSDRLKSGGGLGEAGDTITSQVQPLRIGPEITVFVPAGAGPQTLRWVYEKNGTAAGYEDAGWIDQLEIYDFPSDLPELVLTNIDYVPGTYVLDVDAIEGQPEMKLGTRFLDISVEAQNQGNDLPPLSGVTQGNDSPPLTGELTPADLEVRLSTDRIYGNDGDYVLGSFNQIEGSLESGELLRFIGGLPLGNHIPEGDYYLIARIDPGNRLQDEYSKSNNIFITTNNDVRVERRPRLFMRDFDLDNGNSALVRADADADTSYLADFVEYDETKLYTPEAPLRAQLQIQNIGLDDLFDENGQIIEWTTRVNLVAVLKDDLELIGSADDFVGLLTDPLRLRDFDVAQAMQGRRDGVPEGDVIQIDLEMNLPTAINIRSILEEGEPFEDYMFFLQFVVDVNDTVIESGILNVWNNLNFELAAPIDSSDPTTDVDDGLFQIVSSVPDNLASWKLRYGLPLVGATLAQEEEWLLNYAFAMNPLTAGSSSPVSYGYDVIESETYLNLTFDFARFAGDVVFSVKAADTIADLDLPSSEILRITGPFTASTGPFSLNDDGGLIDHPLVESVVDLGYTARVTVRDSQPISVNPTRFMRIEVLSASDTFVANEMALLGVFGGLNGANDDYDSDGETNLIELLYGRNPTVDESLPPIADLDEFVALLLANYGALGVALPNIGPFDDYDSDGVSNIAELLYGTDPTNPFEFPSITAEAIFVAEQLALAGVEGVALPNIGPADDFDADGVSNIVELMYGTNPNDGSDAPVLSSLDAFVAAELASSGAFGVGVANIGPADDYDSDGITNIVELLYNTNPSSGSSVPALTDLDIYVADELVARGVFGVGVANIGSTQDYDTDLISNIAELMYGTDPTDSNDTPALSPLEQSVAEALAAAGAYQDIVSGFPLANIGPTEDYDSDGANNTVEINAGTDPTDPLDFPGGSVEASILDAFADDGVTPGGSFNGQPVVASDLEPGADLDGDGMSNLMEYALGGSMTDAGDQPESLSAMMDGTDFVVTFVRLKASELPADLEIIFECAETLGGAFAAVPPSDVTEVESLDQTGLLSSDYERVELRVDTTSSSCAFFRVSVQEIP